MLIIQNLEYRQLLIQSIHSCAIKFSEVAANVVYVLMEFLGDSNNPSAVDVIAFVRYVHADFAQYVSWFLPLAKSNLAKCIEGLFGSLENTARRSLVGHALEVADKRYQASNAGDP